MDIAARIRRDFPEVGRAMDEVPAHLTPDWVLASARASVGLEDFGPGFFMASLERLCESLNAEADLNPYGRLLLAGTLRTQLGNRLLLQRQRVEAPERLAKPPMPPIIVTGLPRTGTTFLHRLLAADPGHASLPFWQLNRPIPRTPDDTAEAREAESDGILAIRRAITPELDATHLIRADSPEECMWMTASSMMSRLYWNLAPVYGWLTWYSAQDKTAKYREYLELLSYLQGEYPGRRLVLKAPDHVDGVAELLDVMPEARVICTHRDMTAQIGSILSLGRTTRRLAVNTLDPAREAGAVLALTDHSLARMEMARSRHPGRILDVRYDDLMADPLAQVDRIYRFCGLDMSDRRRAALAAHHAANPRGKHGAHSYTLEEFGLDTRDVRARYGNYSARYLAAGAGA